MEIYSTVIVILVAAAILQAFECRSFHLERTFLLSHNTSELVARDKARHARILRSSANSNAVDFPVRGAFIDNVVGLYISKVSLGTPPRDFHVQIDTGNDNLWVSCSTCKNCPKTTDVKPISHLELFDPRKSSTCEDKSCSLDATSNCSSDRKICSFDISYLDDSETKGLYVYDLLHYDSRVGSAVTSGSTAPIVFGCSEELAGPMAEYSDRAVDGIFGFGRDGISVVSQLASQCLIPKMFSHCLSGDANGGGTLVLGEVQVPNMVYSPFNTSAITKAFPEVEFNFGGGAALELSPQDYLFPLNLTDDEEIWCMGFQEQEGITLLGDLVLKNKMVVYDLDHERIGWANYNCSKMTNISTSWYNNAMRLVYVEFVVWSVVSMSTLFIIQIM